MWTSPHTSTQKMAFNQREIYFGYLVKFLHITHFPRRAEAAQRILYKCCIKHNDIDVNFVINVTNLSLDIDDVLHFFVVGVCVRFFFLERRVQTVHVLEP